MAFNITQVDLPGVFGAVQSYRSNQRRNALLDMQMQEAMEGKRRTQSMNALIPGMRAGDPQATAQAYQTDPMQAAKLEETFRGMDEGRRKQTMQGLEALGKILSDIESAGPQAPQVYQAARDYVSKMGMDVSQVPETYDPGWVRNTKAMLADTANRVRILSAAEARQMGLPEGTVAQQDSKGKVSTVYAPPKPEKETEKQRQIAALTARGLSQQDAENIAYGIVKLAIDPVTGQRTLVNVADGSERQLTTQNSAPPPEPESAAASKTEEPPLLADLAGFGAVPVVREGISATVGQVIPEANSPETTERRQRARLVREQLLNAFARSGRPSNYAQQRVEELIPSMGMLESPQRAYQQYATIYRTLEAELADAQAIAEDRSMSPELRRDAQRQVRDIDRAMRMIGDPARYPSPGREKQSLESNPQAVEIRRLYQEGKISKEEARTRLQELR